MSSTINQPFADYWFDGYEELPGNVIYRSFWALPLARKPTYLVAIIAQLTVWMALTPAKKENGCMKLLAGSHHYDVGVGFQDNVCHKIWRLLCTVARRKLSFVLEYPLGVLGQGRIAGSVFPIIRPVYDEFLRKYARFYDLTCEPKTFEMNPGEFIIFTSATMHGSWPNKSDQDRLAYAARVAGTGTTIHEDYAESTMPLFDRPPVDNKVILASAAS